MPDDNRPYGNNELLHSLLNRKPSPDPLAFPPGYHLPAVPPAPMFRAGTPVVGDKDTAIALEQLLRLAPELRGRVPRVLMGPTNDVVEQLRGLGLSEDAESYGPSNLLGTTAIRDNTITLNPWLGSDPTLPPTKAVLGHELGHVAGWNDGSDEIRSIEEALGWVRKPGSGVKLARRATK